MGQLVACLLAATIFYITNWHVVPVSAAEIVCRLEFVGFGPKGQHGLDRAILECDAPSNEPVLISINQTYLGGFAEDFKGVKVDDSAPCELIASNTFDYLESTSVSPPPPQSRSLASSDSLRNNPSYQISIFPLDNVEAVVSQGLIAANSAGTPLVAVEDASLTLDQGVVEDCTGIVGGAVAAWDKATVLINEHILRSNTARKGGAVFVCGFASLHVKDSVLQKNLALRYGGGLFLYDSARAVISGSKLSGNTAEEYGGGIEVGNFAKLEVRDGSVLEQGHAKWGGCVDALEKSHVVFYEGTSCRNNSASWVGGSDWIGNAARSGGAIYIEGQARLDIAHSRLEHNTALDSDGGGLWAKDFAYVKIRSATSISHNAAFMQGGGLSMWESPDVFITEGSTIFNNTAGRRGGGAYAMGGSMSPLFAEQGSLLVMESGSSITCNRAPVGAGVRLSDATELHLKSGSSITGNAARFDAGGVYVADRSLILVTAKSSISGNKAGRFAGGVALLSNRSDIRELEAVVKGNKARYSAEIAVITTDLQPGDKMIVEKPVEVDSSGVAVLELKATGWYGRGTPGVLVQAVLEPKDAEQDGVILGVNRTGSQGLVTLRLSFAGYTPGDYPVNISVIGTEEIAMLGFEVPDVDVTIRVPVPPSFGSAEQQDLAASHSSSYSHRRMGVSSNTLPLAATTVVILLVVLLLAALMMQMSSKDAAARGAGDCSLGTLTGSMACWPIKLLNDCKMEFDSGVSPVQQALHDLTYVI
eukprot:gene10969-11124_t